MARTRRSYVYKRAAVAMLAAAQTLGIEFAHSLPLEQAGLWGFLLCSSSTFGDMLRRAERYMRVVNKESEFLLENRGSCVAMVCPHPDPSVGASNSLLAKTRSCCDAMFSTCRY